jgi:hypothetical protein
LHVHGCTVFSHSFRAQGDSFHIVPGVGAKGIVTALHAIANNMGYFGQPRYTETLRFVATRIELFPHLSGTLSLSRVFQLAVTVFLLKRS